MNEKLEIDLKALDLCLKLVTSLSMDSLYIKYGEDCVSEAIERRKVAAMKIINDELYNV